MFRTVILVLLAACGRLGFDARVGGDSPNGDGPGDATPLGPFQNATLVLPPSNSSDDDPSLTADMLEMVFDRDGDVAWVKRSSTTSAWETPVILGDLSMSPAIETTPEISPDGQTIYFASNRDGGSQELYVATRTGTTSWSTPQRIVELCSPFGDTAGTTTDTEMVFDSGRNGGSDLFLSTRSNPNVMWNAPVSLDVVNSSGEDGGPFLTVDGASLYFDTTRDGGVSIYVAVRATTDGAFGPPAPVTELNVAQQDTDPWVSPDGRHIFFRSDRDGSSRIYEATR